MDLLNLEAEVIKRFYLSADLKILRSCYLHRELRCDEAMLVIDCPNSLIAVYIWENKMAIATTIVKLAISRKYVIRSEGKVFRPVLSVHDKNL